MRPTSRVAALAVLLVLTSDAAVAQETRAVLVVGIGGDDERRERFHAWGGNVHDGLVRLGVAESNIVYLGERVDIDPERIDDRSTRENLERALQRMGSEAGPDDRVVVVLVGHGTNQGDQARFNLPGPDIGPGDLAVMLSAFPTQQVAVVNTASGSGSFVAPLSGEGRAVVAATRSARELNETWFARFFGEALAGDDTDLDKDGRISLFEAFEYARREVERYYEEEKLILTEHAVLDDDGDGEGTSELGPESGDGALAVTFYLGAVADNAVVDLEQVSDPVLRGLYEERAELERQVQALRLRRDSMDEAAYQDELEALLLDLALKNREIRAREGGGR